jgi:hypothetical protein
MKLLGLTTSIAVCLIIFSKVVLDSDWDNQPALKDVFKEYFPIGGAFNCRLVTDRDPNAAETMNIFQYLF